MWKDPIVEEVRKIREEYARGFNFDIRAMARDLREEERRGGRELVTLPSKPAQVREAAGATTKQ